jgi:hypothetical protein
MSEGDTRMHIRIFPLAGALLASVGCRARAADPATSYLSAAPLRLHADAAYRNKDYAACGRLFDQAAGAHRQDLGAASYNAACCHALAGDRARAFAAPAEAMSRGFRAVADLERDDDLSALHADPRWAPVVARGRANLDRRLRGADGELRRLFDEDQADRLAGPDRIDWAKVEGRDRTRRQRVRAIAEGGRPLTPADLYHAAMILQHGSAPADFALAHHLAARAAAADPTDVEARWLAAAASDRELMTRGKPQRYGTQFRKVDGRWVLHEVDPTITDLERARWNVPSLPEAREKVQALNHPAPAHE